MEPFDLSTATSFRLLAVSLGIAISAGLVSALVGGIIGIFAFLSTSRFSRAFLLFILLPLIWPPFLTAIGWMVALGEGGLTLFQGGAFESLWLTALFSPVGVVAAQSFTYWPIAALLVVWRLRRLDAAVIDQIRMETGSLSRLSNMLLRLALAPIGQSIFLVAVLSLNDIGTPEMLQVMTFPILLYSELNLVRDIAALAQCAFPLIFLILVMGLVWPLIRRWIQIPMEPADDIQGVESRASALVPWTLLGLLLLAGPIGVSVVETAGLVRDWEIVRPSLLAESLWATLVTAAGAIAILGAALMVVSLLSLSRGPAAILECITFLLFALPSPLLGLLLIRLTGALPIFLSGWTESFALLSVACAIRFFWPAWICIRIGEEQTPSVLHDQTALDGASRWQRLISIHIPTLKSWWILSLLLVWVLAVSEVGLCRMLQPPGVQTLAVRTVNFMHWGHDGMVAAGLLLLAFLEILPVLLIAAFSGASGWKRFRRRPALPILLVIPLICVLAGCGSISDWDGESWGERGNWRGALFNPRAVEELADGNWVVLDRTNRVQILTPSGDYIRHWTTPETGQGNPRGLDVDRHGNILVADTHYSQVLRYSPEGELLQTIGGPGDEEGEFCLVTDVVEDASGFLTTIEYGSRVRIQRFDPDGNFIREWGEMGSGPGQLRRPQGLDQLPNGDIVVADSVNHRIQIFDRDGNLLEMWGEYGREPGQLCYPYDVSADEEGRIYIAEFGNHRVQVFNREGKSLYALGKSGRGGKEFYEPWGITVLRSSQVIVADTKNDRIVNLGRLF